VGGVTTKIEKGAMHVSYDPWPRLKRNRASYPLHRATLTAAATDMEGAHPDMPTEKSLITAGM